MSGRDDYCTSRSAEPKLHIEKIETIGEKVHLKSYFSLDYYPRYKLMSWETTHFEIIACFADEDSAENDLWKREFNHYEIHGEENRFPYFDTIEELQLYLKENEEDNKE